MKKLIASVMINTIVATSVMAIGVDAAEKVEQEKQLECLALNVYYETHARSLADAMAVTDVVLNRVETTRYPNTPCEVVHQGYKKGNRYCQFSWYCDGKADIPEDSQTWNEVYQLAQFMMQNGMYDFTDGATHYHNDTVHPYWADHLYHVVTIDNHIFYK